MIELKPSPNESTPHLTLSESLGMSRPSRSATVLIVATLAMAIVGVALPWVMPATHGHAAYKPIIDDDGDDMSYHWQNPKFAIEEGLQMGGIAALVGAIAATATIKRVRLRQSR